MSSLQLDIEDYKNLLLKYIQTKDEAILYQAEQFSKSSIKNNISPDEIVNIHYQAILELFPNLDKGIKDSFHFLIETMIAYGLAHQEYQVLREKQIELRSEIEIAANMQNTLLRTTIPDYKSLDIGAKSVAAKIMNGDYYHFVQDNENNIGVAIADVSGKGIPAAFCMSMIKYAMESFPSNRMYPKDILEMLNRVVNRNVDPGMFVTMFYGLYDVERHQFYYSTAGHEPCLIYRNATNQFEEMEAKGLLLGVKDDVKYKQYVSDIQQDDLIVLLTDGVTECRRGGRFITREEVLDVIQQYIHLNANEIVEKVHKHFERYQDFSLRDDFTIIIIKRTD
ncbi:PP2C family protein-serine/threonine phosphatase [Bacillaceae bacterium W0354]